MGAGTLKAMRRICLLALIGGAALAAEAPPRCGQQLRGTLWPARANDSRDARRQALACGELRICTRGLWRFHWEPVGVPYWRVAGMKAPEGCAEGRTEAGREAGKTGVGPSTD